MWAPRKSAVTSQTRGGCSTCTATSGSGAWTGAETILARTVIRRVLPQDRAACYAAGDGPAPPAAARRPTAATTDRRFATATTVSVLSWPQVSSDTCVRSGGRSSPSVLSASGTARHVGRDRNPDVRAPESGFRSRPTEEVPASFGACDTALWTLGKSGVARDTACRAHSKTATSPAGSRKAGQ